MDAYITLQVKKFNAARGNLLLMIIISAVNLVLTAADSNLYLLFSALLPLLFVELWWGLAFGVIMAVVILLAYFACYILSGRRRVFILPALILFVIDCLVIVWAIWAFGFGATYWLDIAFHVWIMYYLVTGAIAWGRLRRLSADDFKAAEQDLIIQQSIATKIVDENGAVVERGNVPLRFDSKKGRILIQTDYQTLHISMKRSYGLTELIINGQVYDEVKGVAEGTYSLFACVRNVRISGKFNSLKFRMEIYADDVLIAKKMRFY